MNYNTDQIAALASSCLSLRNDVLFAYIFGSHAKGVVSKMSDIDIAVYMVARKIDADVKLDLLHTVSNALGTDQLDLVILNQAPTALAFRILENHILILDRDPFKRHQFESLVMRKYFDFSFIEKGILERRFLNG